MLLSLAPELWIATIPHAFMGLSFGARMTVIRLPDGGLWLHSPLPLTDALRAQVDALGTVTSLVAPNTFHHLHLGPWKAAYPQAILHGAPGLRKKRPDLDLDVDLGEQSPPAWQGVIRARTIPGKMEETVFLHIPSGSLVMTDLLMNIAAGDNAWTRFYLWLLRVQGRLTTSPVVRLSYGDRSSARAAVDQVLDWPWDRLLLCHGDIVESGARARAREALSWL